MEITPGNSNRYIDYITVQQRYRNQFKLYVLKIEDKQEFMKGKLNQCFKRHMV